MKFHGNLRINLFLGFILLLSGLVLYRLFILSIIKHSSYSRTAQAQSESITNIIARGNIYLSDKDSEISLAATNKKFPLVFVVSGDIDAGSKDKVIDALAKILNLEREQLAAKVNSGSKSLRVVA